MSLVRTPRSTPNCCVIEVAVLGIVVTARVGDFPSSRRLPLPLLNGRSERCEQFIRLAVVWTFTSER